MKNTQFFLFACAIWAFMFVGNIHAQNDPQKEITALAKTAVNALKSKDFAALSKLVKDSLRFSAFSYVTETDPIFSAAQVARLAKNKTKYNWADSYIVEETVNKTAAEYLKKSLYNRDFAAAPSVLYNEVGASCAAAQNHAEFYPNSIFVEYHFPSSEEGALDWSCLRFVFQQKGDTHWYLVGIVQEEWTP